MRKKRRHLSYSAFKRYQECPWKYRLKYIDKLVPYEVNIFLAFGKAVHTVLEYKILKEEIDEQALFIKSFRTELEQIPLEFRKENYTPEDMIQFKDQGLRIVSSFMDAFKEHFPDGYEVIDTEEKLDDMRVSDETDFKGFIDLVVKDLKTGKYFIFDHKTCGWGWDARKKSDKMVVYQLSLYKHYFCLKHDIPMEDVETGFILLKRTAKKDFVEFVRVTNGKKRVQNCLEMFYNTAKMIENGVFMKNLLECKNCRDKGVCKKGKKVWKV